MYLRSRLDDELARFDNSLTALDQDTIPVFSNLALVDFTASIDTAFIKTDPILFTGPNDEHGDMPASATNLTLSTVTSGIINDSGDIDYFAFTASLGQELNIYLTSETPLNFDAVTIYIEDDQGNILNAAFPNELLTFTATETNYFIYVSSNITDPLDYQMAVYDTADEVAGDNTTTASIAVDGPDVQGLTENNTDSDWYQLTSALPGQTIRVTGTSNDGSVYLSVYGYGSDGTLYLIDGLVSEAPYTLPDNPDISAFYISAVIVPQNIGAYTLSVEDITDDHANDATTTSALKFDLGSTTGVIEEATDTDWFSFSATEAEAYGFALFFADIVDSGAVRINVRDGDGNLLEIFRYEISELKDQIQFIAPETGTYYLEIAASDEFTINQDAVMSPTFGEYEIVSLTARIGDGIAPLFPVGYLPWTVMPSVPARPTIAPVGDDVYRPVGETIYGPNETHFQSHEFGLSLVVLSELDSSLISQGLIYAEDGLNLLLRPGADGTQVNSWAYAVAGGNGDSFINEGEVFAISSFYSASGFFDVTGFTLFENTGTITAMSFLGTALGVSLLDSFQPHTNSGTIHAWSENSSLGLELDNGGVFDNSGNIIAEGFNDATGVLIGNFGGYFNNSGTITAFSIASPSQGITAFGSNAIGNENNVEAVLIENSGTITADIAIFSPQTDQNGAGPDRYTDIVNDGTINGAILLGAGFDEITNNSVINGDIETAAGDDIYNGASGTLNGTLYLGAGNDTAIGGSGNERIAGGEGQDDLTGGGGRDIFIFEDNGDRDRIRDFNPFEGVIMFNGDPFTGLDGVAFTDRATYMIIAFENGTSVRIDGNDSSDLSNANFLVSGDPDNGFNIIRQGADVTLSTKVGSSSAEKSDDTNVIAERLEDDTFTEFSAYVFEATPEAQRFTLSDISLLQDFGIQFIMGEYSELYLTEFAAINLA